MKPSFAFVAVSWLATLAGLGVYLILLNNASLSFDGKAFFLTVVLFGLFAVISLQKTVRDRIEGVPVTAIYYGIAWVATLASILLMIVGLMNLSMLPSEKGSLGMAFALALFGALAVQKNTRDGDAHTLNAKE